jgi:tRNA (guanine37-N1)-methyltransferase
VIIHIVTIFPDLVREAASHALLGRAQDAGVAKIEVHNLRDYTHDKHKTVDDYPYGGGAGMVMKPEPAFECVESIVSGAKGPERPKVILLTPQGRRFDQEKARELAEMQELVLIAARYEGADERIRTALADEELSIGDFVVSGGEFPALCVCEAIVRLLPGAVGSEESTEDETFSGGLLEYPQYTRPPDFRQMTVPEVLLSGHHEQIRLWRRSQSLRRTLERRPDLLKKEKLTQEDKKILDMFDSRDRSTRIEQAEETNGHNSRDREDTP